MHGLGTDRPNSSRGVLRGAHPGILYRGAMGGHAPEVQSTAHTMLLLQQADGATVLLLLCATAEMYVLLDDFLPMYSIFSSAWISVWQVLWLVRMHLLHAVLSEQSPWHYFYTSIQRILWLLDIRLHAVSTSEAVEHRWHNLGRYFDSSVCHLVCSLPRIFGTFLRWLQWLYV